MSVDAHVPSCAAEGLALSVGNVLLRLRVTILLRHPKVDDMDQIRILRPRPADEEVIWLDITVDEVLLVNGLYSRDLYVGVTSITSVSSVPAQA